MPPLYQYGRVIGKFSWSFGHLGFEFREREKDICFFWGGDSAFRWVVPMLGRKRSGRALDGNDLARCRDINDILGAFFFPVLEFQSLPANTRLSISGRGGAVATHSEHMFYSYSVCLHWVMHRTVLIILLSEYQTKQNYKTVCPTSFWISAHTILLNQINMYVFFEIWKWI